jgi:hypothetical protein
LRDEIAYVETEFSIRDLLAVYDIATETLAKQEIHFKSHLNVQKGRVVIETENKDDLNIVFSRINFGPENLKLAAEKVVDISHVSSAAVRPLGDAVGGRLWWNGPPNSLCTSGFVVAYNGARRLTTAGHCYSGPGYTVSVLNSAGSGYIGMNFKNYALGYISSANSAYHDLEWRDLTNSSSDSIVNMIYDGSGYRVPSAIRTWSQIEAHHLSQPWWAYQGELICKFGVITQQTCGQTQSPYTGAWIWDGAINASAWVNYFVQTTADGTHGDSGGPVYNGGTAYGLVSFGTACAYNQQNIITCDYTHYYPINRVSLLGLAMVTTYP